MRVSAICVSDAPRRLLFVCLLLALASCTNRSGIAEFTEYAEAFDDSAATTTAILDQIGAREKRDNQAIALTPGSAGIDRNFKVEDAEIFSTLTDPPLVAQYKRAIRAIEAYNKLMLGFATGQGYAQSQGNYRSFLDEIVAVSASFSGNETTALTLKATPIIGALNDAVSFGVARESRDYFREQSLARLDDMIDLIEVMRDGAPDLFAFLTATIEDEIINAIVAKRSTAPLKEQHEQARVLMSDWVVLMNRNIAALNSVKRAVETNSSFNVVSATRDLDDFKTSVTSIKAELAKLNAN